LIGTIFYDVGAQPSDVAANLNSHFGALIMMLMMGMMGTAQQALLSFPTERPVFLREYSTNHYSVASYFLSRLTVEAVVTAGSRGSRRTEGFPSARFPSACGFHPQTAVYRRLKIFPQPRKVGLRDFFGF
jgi:hypothetical protein